MWQTIKWPIYALTLASALPDPETKRPCNDVVTLYPLRHSANLRERYTEDTADVFFVGKQTKDRLPAHREVLKIASTVFFSMFTGDWKEKDEKEIPAPEDFSWESFKAAIAVLYDEEVEVEDSSLPDLYRVAHYYDLKAVMCVLVHSIQVWCFLSHMWPVVDLCTVAGQVEDELKQEGDELIISAVRCIAQHLDQIKEASVDITGLSYQTKLMLVQCEGITAPEGDVLATLNQWMDANPDVPMGKAQELFSHVRYGTLPYDSLVQCRVGQSNFDMALANHKKSSISNLSTDVDQITPRFDQKEVLQVYPMVEGLALARQEGRFRYTDVSTSTAVAVICSGREVLSFDIALQFDIQVPVSEAFLACLVCGLYSAEDRGVGSRSEVELQELDDLLDTGVEIVFKHVRVEVNETGIRLTLHSDIGCFNTTVSKAAAMPFNGPFPWILTLGLQATKNSYSFTLILPTGQ